MENEIPRLSPVWEHSLTTLLGHDPTSDAGMALRHSIHFQQVHHILDLLCWDHEKLKTTPAQQVYSLDDCGQGLYLRTNQIKQICGLITYMKHLFGSYNSDIAPQDDPFYPFTHDEWVQQTLIQMRTYLIQCSWACTSTFWAHILNQTYRILNRSNRAHGIQKGY